MGIDLLFAVTMGILLGLVVGFAFILSIVLTIQSQNKIIMARLELIQGTIDNDMNWGD